MPLAKNLIEAAGNATQANYIEDCFSSYLYTGTGADQTITNGIDLAGKGGLVWSKIRSAAGWHALADTARGTTKILYSNSGSAQSTLAESVKSFTSTGYSIGSTYEVNNSGSNLVSWTFRKQPKFFDVVSFTTNGSTNQRVSHNLGSTPGFIICKSYDNFGDWDCYHRSLGRNASINLNSSSTSATNADVWGTSDPTATDFGVSSYLLPSGRQYIAYIFAHDAGGFGLTGTDNVISCGSFTTDGSGNATVNLGWEPQYVLYKKSNADGQWYIEDTMRGLYAPSQVGATLIANLSNAEGAGNGSLWLNSTGFTVNPAMNLGTSTTCIYIAIRRGPMKVPTDGTKVFSPVARSGTGANATVTGIAFPPDYVISPASTNGYGTGVYDRLRGNNRFLLTTGTAFEDSDTNGLMSFNMDGISLGADTAQGYINASGVTYVNYLFKRAPSFFDEVCYTGNVTARTINHNLGAVPEMMIVKTRSSTTGWVVYHQALGNTKYMYLDLNVAQQGPLSSVWNNTTPTSSVFSVGTGTLVNGNAETFVAYLFATCSGVSKVGSYTGTGTTKQVDCGFAAGARFVLIKRTDSTGDWYVWDTARGIVSGNDPYLLLNSSAAEVTSTDYIDPYSAGFEISSTAPADINASGGTFVYLAIA